MQIKFNLVLRRLFILIAPALLLYGCGLWNNFTTYFNLYYDTTDLFGQVEKSIDAQKRDLFSIEPITVPPSSSAQLTKVIEKCSQILQFHAESSYVDDALFIIGKCFYYQTDYPKALRKFEELIATQPKSSLVLETKLWIGRTQMRLKEYNNALATLEDVNATAAKENKKTIEQDVLIEEIKYRISQNDYNRAITLADNLLKVSGDNTIKAEVAYEMGKLYNLVGDPANAIKSFQKVTDYSPSYGTEFNSLVELGKTLRQNGDNQKALDIFDVMSRQQKNLDSLDVIDLQKGLTLLKLDKTNEALDQFYYVDSSFARTPSQGMASYELGKVFLIKYRNFDTAYYFYNRTSASAAPAQYLDDARNKVGLLTKYRVLSNDLQYNRKELSYALNPDLFVKDSIAYSNEIAQEVERARYQAYFDSLKNSSGRMGFDSLKALSALLQADSLKKSDSTFAADSSRVADSLKALGQNPNQALLNNPNQNQFNNPNQLLRPNQNYRGSNVQNQQAQNNALPTITKKPPQRPTVPIDSLQNYVVGSEFELGNLLFTEFNLPDSAYNYYTDILTNYAASPYEAQVLYALGSYYLTMNDSVKADSIFNVVYNNYRNESIVNAAANKLNKPLINVGYDTAQVLYSNAESQMMRAAYDSSLISMYAIYKNHPKSIYAAKALYAAGWILENNKNLNDSAAVVYDTLIKVYPRSIYAMNVSPKIGYYNSEIARLKLAREDSLLALSKANHDTLATDSLKNIQNKMASLESNGARNVNPNLAEKNPNQNAAGIKPEEANTNMIQNNTVSADTLIRVRRKGMNLIR